MNNRECGIVTNITIGNWYLVRGMATKISPANVVWDFRDGCCSIPLTPEILENNGFLLAEENIWEFEDKEAYLIIEKFEDGFAWMGGDYNIAKIDFVHQLQDALRLCGSHKEIRI